MSETKQTRCPFCNSVFNITDAQLAARGGHVRCGACLQVFRADLNLVTGNVAPPPQKPAADEPAPVAPPIVARTQSAQAAPKAETNSAPKKKKKVEDDSWVLDLIGDDDVDMDDLIDKPAPIPVAPPAAPAPAPVAPTAPAPAATAKGKKPLFDDELSDLLQDVWQAPQENSGPLKGLAEVDKLKESADESWAQALLSEIAEEEKREKDKGYSMTTAEVKKEPAPALPATRATQAVAAPAPSRSTAVAPANSAADDDLLNFLNSNSTPTIAQRQTDLPVEIRRYKRPSIDWGYWFTWTFLCGLAALMLISQYIYFNFEKLSIDASTRPKIVSLCGVLHCQVPEPPDLSQIIINKLVIRKHPDLKGVLKLDALLQNKADFAQPLPFLKLVFLNKKGDVVAGRVFTSQEYLAGDLASLRRLPPDTPLHIELDIANPEVDMVKYEMKPLL